MKVYYKILNLSAGVIARQFKTGVGIIEATEEYDRLCKKYQNRDFALIKVTEETIK